MVWGTQPRPQCLLYSLTPFLEKTVVTLRRALALTAGLLTCAGLTLAAPLAASAHTPVVSATCSSVNVDLQFYSSSAEAPEPNTVTVVVDGASVETAPFGASYIGAISLGDETLPHSWTVTVDAVEDRFDRTFTGTSTPCPPAIPEDASAAVVITAATCLSGETLALGPVSSATWGELVQDEATGSYEVTATATSGHLFDDGMPTRTFSGALAGPLPASAAECAPAPVVTTEVTEQVDCDTTMVTVTTTTTTTGWSYDEPTASWLPTEPVVVVTVTERPATEEECTPTQPRPGPEQPAPPAEPVPPVEPAPPAPPAPPAAPPVVAPVVTPPIQLPTLALPERSVPPEELAHNGTDPALAILTALSLLGAGLVFMRRGLRPVG